MLTLSGHKRSVWAVAYLPDGRLASAGSDGRVLVHNLDGRPPACIYKCPHPLYALAVSPDGSLLSAGGHPAAGNAHNPVLTFDLAKRVPANARSSSGDYRGLAPIE